MIDYSLLGDIDLVQVLKRFEHNLMTKFNCAKVATITSFDSSKQQVNVSIDNYPNISGIPLIFPKGQNYSIQLPVNVGDSCIVLFCDTDLDKFKNNEGTAPEYNDDIHGLNGAVALVGISNSSTSISDYISDGLKIKYNNSYITIKDNEIDIDCGGMILKIDSTGITATVGATIMQVGQAGVNITGNLTVTGNIGAAAIAAGGVTMEGGDVTADGVGLKTHTHTYTKAQSARDLVSVTDNTSTGV